MHALNRGKRSVALDFRAPGDEVRLLLQQLVRQADVVVEGFVPGVFWRVLGMTPQELRDACPQLVLCQVSAAGQHGPLSEQPMQCVCPFLPPPSF